MTGSLAFDIVFRTAAVYVVMVVGMLLLGKKELSQMSVTDLVFILLISNAVQNAMLGADVSLMGGLLAAFVLLLLNALFRWLNFKFTWVRRVIEGEPKILILKGQVHAQNMAHEMITEEELMAALREHGVSSVHEVSLSMLEIDGSISVVSDPALPRSLHKRKKHHRGLNR